MGVSVYSASKYALEALSDALRMEMAAFGVRVVLVEPRADLVKNTVAVRVKLVAVDEKSLEVETFKKRLDELDMNPEAERAASGCLLLPGLPGYREGALEPRDGALRQPVHYPREGRLIACEQQWQRRRRPGRGRVVDLHGDAEIGRAWCRERV